VSIAVTEPTPRQLEMLTLHGRGRTYDQIAYELSVSWSTVRHDLADLRESIGAQTLSHALVICIGRGFICVDSRREEAFVPEQFVEAA
jgi:DNA-binding NarL/FixJ family response regulator